MRSHSSDYMIIYETIYDNIHIRHYQAEADKFFLGDFEETHCEGAYGKSQHSKEQQVAYRCGEQ